MTSDEVQAARERLLGDASRLDQRPTHGVAHGTPGVLSESHRYNRQLSADLHLLIADHDRLAAEVERLERVSFDRLDGWNAANKRTREAEARVAELEAGLRPFANIADHLTDAAYGPAWGFNGGVIEHEDFRRARALLSPAQDKGERSNG